MNVKFDVTNFFVVTNFIQIEDDVIMIKKIKNPKIHFSFCSPLAALWRLD